MLFRLVETYGWFGTTIWSYLTKFWNWASDDASGFFTMLLTGIAVFQLALFYRQLSLMRGSLTEAKRAGDAATAAATAAKDAVVAQSSEFVATHRPKIRVKHVYFADKFQPEMGLTAAVECVNNGTTEGSITEFGIKFLCIEKDQFLPFPNPPIPKITWNENAGIECGLTYRLPQVPNAISLTRAQYESIRSGETRLFCIGYLRYLDKAGRLRSTGLCRVLTFPQNPTPDDNGRFRAVEDPDFEYED